MYWLSWNLGTSTSWNPQGLPRPEMGLLYQCSLTTNKIHYYRLNLDIYYFTKYSSARLGSDWTIVISKEVKQPTTVLAYTFIDVIFTIRHIKCKWYTSSCLASTRNLQHSKLQFVSFELREPVFLLFIILSNHFILHLKLSSKLIITFWWPKWIMCCNIKYYIRKLWAR